jgi:iron complex outermembrane receptor protein|tara:strand:- start:304 stop:2538 length:2235 start_codon:yes stop_codon:yes gene_type:complete
MSNIKKIFFLIFFMICLGFSLSQTYHIQGFILDSKTKDPLEKVNIFIENSKVGTTTDKDGFFNLTIDNYFKNNIHLNIEMIGYKKLHLPIQLLENKIDLNEIYLIIESLEFESIHIHSHEKKQISGISLSGQKLNDNLNANIAATLSNQPNIGVNSFGGVTSKPVLRGYSGDRLLLTKDGNEIGDLSQSSIDHVITLDMIQVNEIEVIRGPKSLVYGSNAIGGVINTSISGNPKVKVEKFHTKLILGGESYNKGIYGNMMLYVPIKNSQINVSLSNRATKNQSSPIGTLENTYSENQNLKIGFTHYRKNNFINFIVENYSMDYGIPPSLDFGHENGVDIQLLKNTFQINYHHDILFSNFNQFDIKYNFIDYEHQEFENEASNSSVTLSKNTHNVKIELQSINLIIGSEINFIQFLPSGYYFTPITDELKLSLYSYYEKEFKGFDLFSAFRIGYLSIDPKQKMISMSNLDPEDIKKRSFEYYSSSIGIKKVINKIEINSWIMSTMRGPRIEELFSDGPHLAAYSYEIGEPNLELEKTYGIESSILYNSNHFNTSVTTFYNYSPYYYQMTKMGECDGEYVYGVTHPCQGEDYIQFYVGPGWLYKYQTKGVKSLIKGLEFNLDYHYQNFRIIYDFSLVRGDNLTADIPLSYMNPDKQILKFEYEKKLMNYKIRFTKIHSQNRLGEFESYTPSTYLTDFIINYSNNNQNITIQLNNILNEEYFNHLSKIKSIMPEAGRNILINYKIFL